MLANPSLVNMYTVTKYLAKEAGYRPPEELQAAMDKYVGVQQGKMRDSGDLNDIKTLKTGDSMQFGEVVVQYGSSALMSPTVLYDRYVVFRNHPNARYLVMMWPLGLLQASVNPFIKGKNPHHLGELAQKVMEKYKGSLMSTPVSLDYIKNVFEKKVKEDSVGFNFNDFIALFEKYAKGLDGRIEWKEIIKTITDKRYTDLTPREHNYLRKITVSAWDVVQAQSGGHPNITNISGLNFIGKGYVDMMKEMAMGIVKEIMNRLKGDNQEG
jgi:hypothetical protein